MEFSSQKPPRPEKSCLHRLRLQRESDRSFFDAAFLDIAHDKNEAERLR